MHNVRASRVARFAAITTLGFLSALTACKPTKRPEIAVIPETTAQEIWESEHAGAAREASKLGWDIYWNGPSREDDLPRQIQIVNNAIARGVIGLVLAPDHAIALISPVRAAVARGIPTVIVSSPLGTFSNRDVMFVMNDDEAAGQMAADRAAKYLSKKGSIAVLGVNPNLLGSIKTADALESSLFQRLPEAKVIEKRSTSFSFAEAEETAEEIIRSTPSLQVIITLNVTQTRAVYEAASSTNSLRRIKLIACNQDLDLLFRLRAGEIDAIIAQDTTTMGKIAIQLIQQHLRGNRNRATIIVQPILITQENVDSPKVQEVLDMNWRDQ
jgi:ribose transport system substrate-binding protein